MPGFGIDGDGPLVPPGPGPAPGPPIGAPLRVMMYSPSGVYTRPGSWKCTTARSDSTGGLTVGVWRPPGPDFRPSNSPGTR